RALFSLFFTPNTTSTWKMLIKYREEVVRLISEAGFELAVPDLLDFEKIGLGGISSVFRVKLKDDASIAVKLTEMDVSHISSELHNREIEFYEWVKSEGRVADHLKCPKFYSGYACTDTMGIILMEDFSHLICNDLDYLKGFSVDIALKLVRELTAFQCLLLSSSGVELKNRIDRFDYSSDVRNYLPRIDQIEGISAEMRSKLNEWIEPVTLFKIQADIPPGVEGISRTLIHCDIHQENLLVYRNESEIDLLSIIDWQFFKIGNPLLDVASILGVSMTPEDRREYTTTVLGVYLEEIEKRRAEFTKPFDMTFDKAHRLLNNAFRWACVQLTTDVVTTTNGKKEENPTEYDVTLLRLQELMKD
ncbi:hypothetical protein PENTCL1PPCAC_27714, partial [Pristionchus entomophagus]